MKTDLFQSWGWCWVFQICWHFECSTFTASSFRIWNSQLEFHKCRTKSIDHKGKSKDLLDHGNVNFHVWKDTFNWLKKLAIEWSYIFITYTFNKVFFCIRDRLKTYIYVYIYIYIYTHTHKVDHWTILVLTVLVHLYVYFFFK